MRFKLRNGFKRIMQKIISLKWWIIFAIALYFIIILLSSIMSFINIIFISKIAEEFIDTNISWLEILSIIMLSTIILSAGIVFPYLTSVMTFIGSMLAIDEIKQREEELCQLSEQ